MTLQPTAHYVTAAHDELCQVREWLLRPSTETLEACPPALERAISYVHELSAQIDQSEPDHTLIQPLLALSHEIRAAQRILHAAGALHFARLRHVMHPDA